MDNPIVQFVLFLAGGYVVGDTPFAVLIARGKGVNIRAVGSGNAGATNVARMIGWPYGAACFVLDVAKGLVPVLAAGAILRAEGGAVPTAARQAIWIAAGIGAICGHVFSVYLRFRGGKGVATSLGVVMGIFPYFTWAGLAAFAVWIVVTVLTRYVSLASVLAAAVFLPLFVLVAQFVLEVSVFDLWVLALFALGVALLVIVRHRTNIIRLLNGTEAKIGRHRPTDEV